MAEVEPVGYWCVKFDNWLGRHGGKNKFEKRHVAVTEKGPKSEARGTKPLKKSTTHVKTRLEEEDEETSFVLGSHCLSSNRETWTCQTQAL